MATLKGQNFRIYVGQSVVGKSTGCSVTLNGNTEDATHKDITGMASAPSIVSKSWSVQVDSLDACNAASLLKAIKSGEPVMVMWNESSTQNNQTAIKAAFARRGQAFVSDVTFNWNDRENSTKALTLTGSGPLEKLTSVPTTTILPVDNYLTKGQFVRLLLASNSNSLPFVIAAARQLSLHVSMSLESATTKDTEGDWDVMEPTQLSYDISSTALMRSGDTITSTAGAQTLANIENIYEASEPVNFDIAFVGGANQRTKIMSIVRGTATITQLSLNGPNRQNADYTTQLTGVGDYTPVADIYVGTFGNDPSGEGDKAIGPIYLEEGNNLETPPYQVLAGEGLNLWNNDNQSFVLGEFVGGFDQAIDITESGTYYIVRKGADQDIPGKMPYFIIP